MVKCQNKQHFNRIVRMQARWQNRMGFYIIYGKRKCTMQIERTVTGNVRCHESWCWKTDLYHSFKLQWRRLHTAQCTQLLILDALHLIMPYCCCWLFWCCCYIKRSKKNIWNIIYFTVHCSVSEQCFCLHFPKFSNFHLAAFHRCKSTYRLKLLRNCISITLNKLADEKRENNEEMHFWRVNIQIRSTSSILWQHNSIFFDDSVVSLLSLVVFFLCHFI